MIRLVLASHGSLADGMKTAVEMIIGESEHISSFSLSQYKNPKDIFDAVSNLIQANQNDTFIMLSDIKGGSIHNQLITLCNKDNIFLVSGMNLNLAIRDIEGGAKLLLDPRSKDIEIFVIVRNIKYALRLTKLTNGSIKHINIGGLKKGEGTKMVTNGISISNEDLDNLKELDSLVDELEFRLVATDPKILFKNI